MDVTSQCHNCKHLRSASVGYTCDAFPDGIPDAIVFNEYDHREPFTGDNGIRYEPVDPEFQTGFES